MAVDVVRVKKRLLEMAKITARILEEHNIPYAIAYGTLLGAVRHRGFIPWDEDFDFWLFDETYNEALEHLRRELPDTLFLEDQNSEPNYFHAWAHVKDLRSEALSENYPQDNCYAHKGLSLDLYRLKKVKSNGLRQYLDEENWAYILRRKQLGLIDEAEFRRRVIQLRQTKQKLNERAEEIEREVYALIISYSCKQLEITDVLPLKRYSFEDTIFFGPHDADKILTDIYGDYMTLPPLTERKRGHTSVTFFE